MRRTDRAYANPRRSSSARLPRFALDANTPTDIERPRANDARALLDQVDQVTAESTPRVLGHHVGVRLELDVGLGLPHVRVPDRPARSDPP